MPPPRNPYLESQWEKLSASMANLNTYKKVRVKKKRKILLDEEQAFCRLNFIVVNKKSFAESFQPFSFLGEVYNEICEI